MNKPRIGLELIIFGGRPAQDLPGVLHEVKQAGYDGIETTNLFQDFEPALVKQLFADTGLVAAACYSGFRDLQSAEAVDRNLAYLHEMGGRYIVASGIKPSEGLAAVEEEAVVLNEAGRRCHDAGITLCYHNHAWEFEEIAGQRVIHRLAALTDPDVVKLCPDVYWVQVGGEQPSEFIARYAGRAPYFHIKDGAPGRFTELGRGEVDLKAATQAMLATGPEWIVCEQDRTTKTPLESITESRDYLRAELGL